VQRHERDGGLPQARRRRRARGPEQVVEAHAGDVFLDHERQAGQVGPHGREPQRRCRVGRGVEQHCLGRDRRRLPAVVVALDDEALGGT
jgi:hypothetical protein